MQLQNAMAACISKDDVLNELERIIKSEFSVCEKEETLMMVAGSSVLNKTWVSQHKASVNDIYDPRILATLTNRGMLSIPNAVTYVQGTQATIIDMLNKWGNHMRAFANSVMSFNQRHAEDGNTEQYENDIKQLMKASTTTLKHAWRIDLPTGQLLTGRIEGPFEVTARGADGTIPTLSCYGEIQRLQTAIMTLSKLFYEFNEHIAGGLGWCVKKTDPKHELQAALDLDKVFEPVRQLLIDLQLALCLWIVKSLEY